MRGGRRIEVDARTHFEVAEPFEASLREALAERAWVDAIFCEAAGDHSHATADGAPVGRAPLREIELAAAGEARPVLVRRGLRGGWLAPLLGDRHHSPARVAREFALTLSLHARGAPVPEPVFAAARRSGPFWRSAFATVRLDGTRDIRTQLDAPEGARVLTARQSAELARAAGDAIRRFHDAGARHADLHLGNLVAAGESDAPRVWLVDLDAAQGGSPPAFERRAEELLRLLRSLRKHGRDEPRWIAACLSGYCAGDRSLRQALVAEARRRWPALERHERRRRHLQALGLLGSSRS